MARHRLGRGQSRKNQSRPRLAKAAIEALEERQLMSLTIDIRDASGNTSATATAVGQVINLDVIAYVKGTNNNPAADGVQDVVGSILANGSSPRAVGGTLAATRFGPFVANGSADGTQRDLNADGNLDVGSNAPANTDIATDGFFHARAGAEENVGNDVNGGLEVQIATLTYTVTSLAGGAETDLVFRPGPATQEFTAAWFQDDQTPTQNNLNDTFTGGVPFVINDPALIVAPVANNDAVSVFRNNPTSVPVLANDTEDQAYNLSSLTVTNTPAHGQTAVQPDGTILYTPTTGFAGSDSFQYTIADVNGRTSNVGTVSVTITVPPAPTAAADSASTSRTVAAVIPVLANDTFPVPAVPGSVAISAPPAHGTVGINTSDGSITYTPTGLFTGTDTFQYTVADTDGETSAPATVTVAVAAPAPPVAVNDTATVVAGGSLTIDVAANDTAATGAIQPATVAVVTPPAHGTATVQPSGAVLYAATAGYTGPDTFTYTVQNQFGDVSNPGTVAVSIAAGTPPTAVPDTAQTAQGAPVYINAAGNDTASTDGGLNASSIVINSNPAHGTAALVPLGVDFLPGSTGAVGDILYTPDPTFIGTDAFTYSIGDGFGNQSAPVTVTVAVTQAAAPTAGAPTATALTGTAAVIDPTKGAVSTIPLAATTTAVTVAPLHGTATVGADGMISYAAGPGFVGTDTFGYTIKDIDGQLSPVVTESVDIGTTLSSAKGAARTLVFVDANGGTQTVSLNLGQADVFFAGAGTATTARGRVTVAGTGLSVGSIQLSGTTVRSGLSIRGRAATPLSIGSITDAGPVGAIVAPTTTLTGTLSLAGASSIQFGAFSGANISTGGVATQRLNVAVGAATDSNFTTGETVRSFRAGSWAATNNSSPAATINAPAVLGFSVLHGFGGDLVTPTAGNVVIRGGLTGAIRTTTANLVEVVGDATAAVIQLGTARAVVVTGILSGSQVFSAGNVGLASFGLVNGQSVVEIGLPAGSFVNLTDATAANLGTATLGALRITGRTTGGISNSTVVAGTIKSASLGIIGTGNGGVRQGVAAAHFGAVSGIVAGRGLRLGAKQLATEPTLTAYLTSKGFSLGDFDILIAS